MRRGILIAAGLIVCSSASAAPVVAVGRLASEKTCSLYKMTSGRHREAGVVDEYGGAYAAETTWRDYLVRDCVDHFASLRTSIEAALASSGHLIVASAPTGAYVVTGRISEVSGGGAAQPAELAPGGSYAISSSDMLVNMDVELRNGTGQVAYGGLLTKKIQTGFSMETRGLSSSNVQSGQAVYTELQHQVALAVARIIAFKLSPLRVTSVRGNAVDLNYGAPLLQLGSTVQVAAADGSMVRFNVIGAGRETAQATYEGGGDLQAVRPGAEATVLEDDDPGANGRRFDRVDLP